MGKCESYMHKYAKIVLAGWLRKKISKNWKALTNIDLPMDELSKSKPYSSVFVEYPVCLDKTNNKMVGLKYAGNFDPAKTLVSVCSVWQQEFQRANIKPTLKSYIPTFKDLEQLNLKPLQIFDLAVVSNHKIVAAFEIKHKNAMNAKKISFIKKHGIPTYEISAQWIMERVRIPQKLECIQSFTS